MCPCQMSGRVGRGAPGVGREGVVAERMGSMGWEEGGG